MIELLLSLAIFSIIGMATFKHITQIQNTKSAAFEDLDLYNDIRASLSLMRNDLSQAFHILYDDLGAQVKAAIAQNQPIPHTLFDGREKEMIFTSLSHRVYYVGKRECEQTEISYFLQPKEGHKFPSLMKRESEIIDADLYQGGPIFDILENVQTLKFEYWDERIARWVTDWSSDQGNYRDRFPKAIKVTLEVSGRNNQTVKIATTIKVAFPNNEPYLVKF